jgi:hypothetical protein
VIIRTQHSQLPVNVSCACPLSPSPVLNHSLRTTSLSYKTLSLTPLPPLFFPPQSANRSSGGIIHMASITNGKGIQNSAVSTSATKMSRMEGCHSSSLGWEGGELWVFAMRWGLVGGFKNYSLVIPSSYAFSPRETDIQTHLLPPQCPPPRCRRWHIAIYQNNVLRLDFQVLVTKLLPSILPDCLLFERKHGWLLSSESLS